MVVYGIVKYRDIFDKLRETTFGYRITASRELVRLEGKREYKQIHVAAARSRVNPPPQSLVSVHRLEPSRPPHEYLLLPLESSIGIGVRVTRRNL